MNFKILFFNLLLFFIGIKILFLMSNVNPLILLLIIIIIIVIISRKNGSEATK
jgi:hypothetical protein